MYCINLLFGHLIFIQRILEIFRRWTSACIDLHTWWRSDRPNQGWEFLLLPPLWGISGHQKHWNLPRWQLQEEGAGIHSNYTVSSAVHNYCGIFLVLWYKIRSGVIWQIDKGKKVWKNVSNSLNLLLEEAYQGKSVDVKRKNLSVSLVSVLKSEVIIRY